MRTIFPLCLTILLAATCRDRLVAGEFAPAEDLRRPVAMALSADESRLLAANRDSGSVSILDAKELKCLNEVAIGKQLSDIARIDEEHFLVTDRSAHELILLIHDDKTLRVLHRLRLRPYPVDVVIAQNQSTAYVSSLWSRSLSIIDIQLDGSQLQVTKTINLDFAPDKLLLVNEDQELIVADHFAGRFAIVDCDSQKIEGVRTFFAENIRGLGVDPRSKLLAVSHTMLNEYAHTVRTDVHWGVLMSNDLRWLNLPEVLDPAGDFYNKGHMHPLGEPGMGGADPGELALFADGTVVVPLTGMNKVAFGKEGDFGMQRVDVGRGPTTAIASDKLRRAFVANTFDDSISVIDIDEGKVIKTISLGPKRKLTQAELGEMLFHDGRLSHDGWMTCQSCHTDGHTNAGLNDNFSDKSFGAPKLVLSLHGAKATAPYAWNGATDTLAAQIRKSNKVTMQGREMSDDQVAQLAAYVRTLDPLPSVDVLRGTVHQKQIAQGRQIFETRDCTSCHTPPLYTSEDTYDVGLTDQQGNTRFNPPSLRGVGQRGPYFHDASAKTLPEVFTEHGHQLDGKPLSDDELQSLLAFLRSL